MCGRRLRKLVPALVAAGLQSGCAVVAFEAGSVVSLVRCSRAGGVWTSGYSGRSRFTTKSAARLSSGGRQQRLVFAALLLHRNEVVSVDRLIDVLWGERAPTNAVKNVQVHALAPAQGTRAESRRGRESSNTIVRTGANGYVLEVAPGELDADRFQGLAEDGRRALADGRPEHAEPRFCGRRSRFGVGRHWPTSPTTRSRRARSTGSSSSGCGALEERSTPILLSVATMTSSAELQGLVAEHPLRERSRGQLILALYRSGRKADALRVYEEATARVGRGTGSRAERRACSTSTGRFSRTTPPCLRLPAFRRRSRPLELLARRRRCFPAGEECCSASAVRCCSRAALAVGVLEMTRNRASPGSSPSRRTRWRRSTRRRTESSPIPVGARPASVLFANGCAMGGQPRRRHRDAHRPESGASRQDDRDRHGADRPRLARRCGVGDRRRSVGSSCGSTRPSTMSSIGSTRSRSERSSLPPLQPERSRRRPTPSGQSAEASSRLRACSASIRRRSGYTDRRDRQRPDGDRRRIRRPLGNRRLREHGLPNRPGGSRHRDNPGRPRRERGRRRRGGGLGRRQPRRRRRQDRPRDELAGDHDPRRPLPERHAVGAGAVWVANRNDGTVSRIDPETNDVVKTIEVGKRSGGDSSPRDRSGSRFRRARRRLPEAVRAAASRGSAPRTTFEPTRRSTRRARSTTRPAPSCSTIRTRLLPRARVSYPEVAASLPHVRPTGRRTRSRSERALRSRPRNEERVTAETFRSAIERSLNPKNGTSQAVT